MRSYLLVKRLRDSSDRLRSSSESRWSLTGRRAGVGEVGDVGGGVFAIDDDDDVFAVDDDDDVFADDTFADYNSSE